MTKKECEQIKQDYKMLYGYIDSNNLYNDEFYQGKLRGYFEVMSVLKISKCMKQLEYEAKKDNNQINSFLESYGMK